jgi:dTDP-4-amino-4,6-dideoxygalactose transaminase
MTFDSKKPASLPEFLPFAPPCVGDEEMAELADALRSGWLTKGPKTQRFEEEIAAYLGADSALAVSSCTAALHLSLRALGVGPGDGVLTTPLTFVSTVHAIVYTGAHPYFCDIDPYTGNLSPEKTLDFFLLKTKKGPNGERIHMETGRVIKAILPVHYGGDPVNLRKFKIQSEAFKVHIVEDAAHAMGSYIGKYPVGNANLAKPYGDSEKHNFTAFSFYATKNLAAGEGGLLTCDSEELLHKARVLSSYGISDARRIWGRYAPRGTHVYDVEELGFKNNFTDLQAAVALVQLKKFPQMQAKRRLFAEIYQKALDPLKELAIIPRERDSTIHAWHLFPLRLKLPRLKIDRNSFIELLRERNLGASVMFIPVHAFSYYKNLLKLPENAFPQALKFYKSEISLPMSPKAEPELMEKAAAVVAELLEENAK